jgi:hypothetical protein
MRDQDNRVKNLSHKVKNVFLQDHVMYFPDHKTRTIRCTKTVAGKFRENIVYIFDDEFTNTYSTKWQCSVKFIWLVTRITLTTVTLTFF